MAEHSLILIIVIPLMASCFNILLGLFRRGFCYPLVIATLSLCVILSIFIMDGVINNGVIHYRLGGWAPPWGIEYVVDHLNAFVMTIISFISLFVAVYSKRSLEAELPGRTVYFYTVFLLLVTGLLGITVTGDVFNLYVFLEITSLAGYALTAIGRDKALLASFNYLIMGTIGACFYLLGLVYLYIATGSLNMADLSRLLPDLYHSKVVLVAFAFFAVGVAIKMALFPLHVWLPDAYTYAPSTVSALAASTMTKVGVYVMIRIMFTVFKPNFSAEMLPVTEILGWVASGAMIFGCILVIAQTDVKRMLSYILIAEVGYIVIGVSVTNRMGFTGALLHILFDAFMMACLFMVAGVVMHKTGKTSIHGFRQLHRRMPITMAAFTIAALSVIGVPPTAGFFSKWYLVLGAIYARKWIFAGMLLLSSLLAVVAFFRVIENIYFAPSCHAHDRVGQEGIVRDEAPLSMLVPLLTMAAGILILGFFSGKIVSAVIQFTVPEGF